VRDAQATVGNRPNPVGARQAEPVHAGWRGDVVGFPALAGRSGQACVIRRVGCARPLQGDDGGRL